MSMLYECVRLLQPTHEMIHQAWCMGLEYSIGTSSMGLNTLSVIAELTGREVGQWFVKPPETFAEFIQQQDELLDLQLEHESQLQKDGGGAPRVPRNRNTNKSILPAFARVFGSADDVMTVEEVEQKRVELRTRREARVEYQRRAATTNLQNLTLIDAQAMADDCLGETIGSMSLEPLVRPKRARGAGGTSGAGGAGGSADSPMDIDPGRPHEEGVPLTILPGRAGRATPSPLPLQLPEFREQLDDETMSVYESEMPRPLFGHRMWAVHRQDPGSFSPGDRMVYDAYHAARSVDFPGAKNCCIGHAATAELMLKCPYCKNEIEHDAAAAARAVDTEAPEGGIDTEVAEIATHLSLAASCVWPDLLEAGMFYLPQTCAQWAAGEATFVEPGGCPALGTSRRGVAFDYKKKNNATGGAQLVDIGWLQANGDQFKTWQGTASYIVNRGNKIVKEFDFHPDGLRDLLYLCSTADNQRRCPEEPKLQASCLPIQNVQTTDGKRIGEHTVVVKISPYKLPGNSKVLDKRHLHLPRDPRSHVADSEFQRRMDSMLHGGRLSALGILISNRVIVSPPIRMLQDGFEVNVAAIHSHLALVAESVLSCALVPGLRNMQEKLCNRQSGPEGLSAPRSTHAAAVGCKRNEDGSTKDAQTLDPRVIHTLPYSYDVVGLALGLDMGRTLYDDVGEREVLSVADGYGDLDLDIGFEDLPQLSTRFVGYSEFNRQTISIKRENARPEGQPFTEVGDPDESESTISIAHVRRSLGRQPTERDMSRYIGRRQGSRSMSGVRGDVFALSTWRKHTATTLKNRGLTNGSRDHVVITCFFDMDLCLEARKLEAASVAKLDSMYEALALDRAEPGTYAAVEKEAVVKKVARRETVAAEINSLSFDASEPMVRRLERGPPARPGRNGIFLGAGPQQVE
jgi:hypothetical protein